MGLTDAIDTLNDITEAKDTIEAKMDTSVIDYENFSTATACMESAIKHEVYTLKLRGIHLGGEVKVDFIVPMIEAMIKVPSNNLLTPPDLVDFNMDLSISKITSPKVGDLPQCLSDTITGAIMSIDTGIDILDPFNKLIDGVNSLTSAATPTLNSTASSFVNNMNSLVYEANKIISKSLESITDPTDYKLFVELDSLQEYLEKTSYLKTYMNWKDMTKCIDTNCPPLKDKIMRDDFMWDADRKNFLMPIDMNSGSIRIAKFLPEASKDELRKCAEIETRYYKYLKDKRDIAYENARKLRESKVDDSKNPFKSILDSSSVTDTINNLF